MDPFRQIRMLIAPFFFFSTLVVAIFLTPGTVTALILKVFPAGKQVSVIQIVVAIVGFVGVAAIPVGFLINSLTILLLKLFYIPSEHNYNEKFRPEAVNRVWTKYGSSLDRLLQDEERSDRTWNRRKREKFFIAVTFDHDILYRHSKGIHEWIARAYSAYVASANSCVALVASALVVWLTCLAPPVWWWVVTLPTAAIMFLGAVLAKRDVDQMTEFQTWREFPSGWPDSTRRSSPPAENAAEGTSPATGAPDSPTTACS